mgnify:CR=1 FL=1
MHRHLILTVKKIIHSINKKNKSEYEQVLINVSIPGILGVSGRSTQ